MRRRKEISSNKSGRVGEKDALTIIGGIAVLAVFMLGGFLSFEAYRISGLQSSNSALSKQLVQANKFDQLLTQLLLAPSVSGPAKLTPQQQQILNQLKQLENPATTAVHTDMPVRSPDADTHSSSIAPNRLTGLFLSPPPARLHAAQRKGARSPGRASAPRHGRSATRAHAARSMKQAGTRSRQGVVSGPSRAGTHREPPHRK